MGFINFLIAAAPDRDFIRIGHLMDAVGTSNPNTHLKFEKILLSPRNQLSITKPKNMANRLGEFSVGRTSNIHDDIVGDTLNTLHEVRKALGVDTLREFFRDMKKMYQKMFRRIMLNGNSSRGTSMTSKNKAG